MIDGCPYLKSADRSDIEAFLLDGEWVKIIDYQSYFDHYGYPHISTIDAEELQVRIDSLSSEISDAEGHVDDLLDDINRLHKSFKARKATLYKTKITTDNTDTGFINKLEELFDEFLDEVDNLEYN